MSHVRVKDRDYFIQLDQIKDLKNLLQPGDILIERRNWHMTNIGIPGFWPHMALYVGEPNEAKKYVQSIVSEDEFIHRFAEVLDQWTQAVDDDGFPGCVLEALRPGVIINSLERSAHCDHLAVSRPRISPGTKFEAIEQAFKMLGRPYDYNFDFSTDNELVCSELICKAYQHAPT